MRRGMGVLAVSALAILAGAVPAASAASQAGWSCVAEDSEAGWTLLASGGSSFPIPPHVPPEGPKVITAWKVELSPGVGPIAQRLELFRPRTEFGDFEKIGESATETLVTGVNSFPTRIPASEGNSVGLNGPLATVFCDKEDGAISWLHDGPVALGQTTRFETEVDVGTPVVVSVEDDRDGDGFGDETQDACPQSAASQATCPPVTVAATGRPRRRAIMVEVVTGGSAAVTVSGQVGWGFRPRGKRAAISAKRDKRGKRRLIIGLRSVTKQVTAGAAVRFRVPLPRAVLRRLGRISPRERLKAKLWVIARDPLGRETADRLSVRLRGRDRD